MTKWVCTYKICTMQVKDEELEFEWDKGNKDKSRLKHGVTTDEAESIFTNEESVILPDEKHSFVEKRLAIFGRSELDRHLYVIFTVRGKKIRIISARRMHREEVEKYAKNKKIA